MIVVNHSYVVNPCGVGVGKDAYFRVQVLPNDYPDEKIVWSNETAGADDRKPLRQRPMRAEGCHLLSLLAAEPQSVRSCGSSGRYNVFERFKNVFDAHQMG